MKERDRETAGEMMDGESSNIHLSVRLLSLSLLFVCRVSSCRPWNRTLAAGREEEEDRRRELDSIRSKHVMSGMSDSRDADKAPPPPDGRTGSRVWIDDDRILFVFLFRYLSWTNLTCRYWSPEAEKKRRRSSFNSVLLIGRRHPGYAPSMTIGRALLAPEPDGGILVASAANLTNNVVMMNTHTTAGHYRPTPPLLISRRDEIIAPCFSTTTNFF